MSTSFLGNITHIPFMNTSTTGMCVLQTTDEVDIGGHYNSTLEQGQCFVLPVLTLPQTAPERMSNVGHSQAAIGQSEGQCPLMCTGHPPCRTPPEVAQKSSDGLAAGVSITILFSVMIASTSTGSMYIFHSPSHSPFRGALVAIPSSTATIGSKAVYLSQFFSNQFGLGPTMRLENSQIVDRQFHFAFFMCDDNSWYHYTSIWMVSLLVQLLLVNMIICY